MIDSSSNKKKLLFGMFVVSFMLLYTVLNERGLLKVRELIAERESIKSMSIRLEAENSKLESQIYALSKDIKVIEKAARNELDLVRKDEILYKFADK